MNISIFLVRLIEYHYISKFERGIMYENFIAAQKVKLEHEKKRLDSEIKELDIYPESGTSDDDHEQEVTQFEENQSVDDNLISERIAVIKALSRIENGSYGKCIKCGAEIPINRLEAYPAADDCIKCSGN